jgi:4'-phosphopantetheinyl transferase
MRVRLDKRRAQNFMPSKARLLEDHQVHVWFRSLDSADVDAVTVLAYLSPDEKQRAERYHYDQHRNEFILSRGTLRLALSSYTGISPELLSFEYSKHGKPSFAATHEARRLQFNLSHTHGMMLLAVVRNRRIGVDIEKIRSDFNVRQIAERFFSLQEQSVLRTVPDEQQYQAFFRCWTRKEAYIKAKGEGMSIPLRDFDVSLDRDSAVLQGTRPDESEARKWKMFDLQIAPDYAATAVIEADSGADLEVRVGEFQNLQPTPWLADL